MNLLLICLIPIIVIGIAKIAFPHKITWQEKFLSLAISIVITCVSYGIGYTLTDQTRDTQILNGHVLAKERDHGTYLDPYDCNCVTTCDDKNNCTEKCDTCYERRYTVTWTCDTTVRNFTVEHLDKTSSSVYDTPDPKNYTAIVIDEPVAVESLYTNYVKATKDSLFHPNAIQGFEQLLPQYPQVYGLYSIKRVLDVKVGIPDLATWNQKLNQVADKVGAAKQANPILIFVNTNNQNYINALKAHWVGGKKNDIVVVIGSSQYPQIDWVDVMSWSDNALFPVELRDEVFNHRVIDVSIVDTIHNRIAKSFVRKPMAEFKYLLDQIKPPMAVYVVAIVLTLISSIFLSVMSIRGDLFVAFNGYLPDNRFRRFKR